MLYKEVTTMEEGKKMITIKFSTANDAFDVPGPEIARILRELARLVEDGVIGGDVYKVRDINGNTVGQFKYTEV